jgi:hypothetical protein
VKGLTLLKRLSLLAVLSMVFVIVPIANASSPVVGTKVMITEPNNESSVYYSEVDTGSHVEFLFDAYITFDVDPTNSRIIMSFSNDYAYRAADVSFDLIFSGGELDKILSVTKNASASTSIYPATAMVTGDNRVKFELTAVGEVLSSDGVIVWDFTSIAFASTPSDIELASGSANPVSGITNVVIPAVGETNATGAVTSWMSGTADTIRFTVTDVGSAASTITINGVPYTNGMDYVISTALQDLDIEVTTAESGKTTVVRHFTVPVEAAVPVSPVSPLSNDALNTFGWTAVPSFDSVTDYEYSLNGGITWTDATDNPQPIPDQAYASGQIQIRVKADGAIGRPAGLVLGSTSSYTVTPLTPEAPSTPIEHDGVNTFGWMNAVGFSSATDYEFSLDGGSTWTNATENPQPIPDQAYASGQIQIRVKADGTTGRPAGLVLSSTSAYTVTPPAPQAPGVSESHDGMNIFGWAKVLEFENVSDYEYSLDSGLTWIEATGNPQSIPDQAYAIGQVQARVKANVTNGRPAGASVLSTVAYTVTPPAPAAPSGPVERDSANTFAWTIVTGFESSTDYEYSLDGGLTWADVTNNPQRIPDRSYAIGKVQVRVKADESNGRPAGSAVLSTTAYTATPDQDTSAPIGPAPVKGANDTSQNEYWLVNGKPAGLLTTATTDINGQQVTTVSLDPGMLNTLLNTEDDQNLVSIAVNLTLAETVIGELTGELIASMADKGTVLELTTAVGSYRVSAKELRINELADKLGASANLKDMRIKLEISGLPVSAAKTTEASLNKQGLIMLTPPVSFKITAAYENKEIKVDRFTSLVERTIPLPNGIKLDAIITGIMITSDGKTRHVPTRIMEKDGNYYAVLSGTANGMFTLVQHKVSFSDINNHWAKQAIVAMGSRLVISGMGDGQFQPNKAITRAEFASILVRALGIAPDAGGASFVDVGQADWFLADVGAAHNYGLIYGISADIFSPHQAITREQSMAMLARAMKIAGIVHTEISQEEVDKLLAGFKDSAAISPYVKRDIAASVSAGIINGKNGSLAPQQNITRAEVALIMQKLLEKAKLI